MDYEERLKSNLKNGFPLHYAVMNNDIDKVRNLLKTGEAPKWVNVLDTVGDRCTPLMYAIQWRIDMEIIDALLGYKAIDVNVKDHQNNTALHFAVLDINVEVVKKLLLFANIDLTIKNYEDETALEIAKGVPNEKMKEIINMIKQSSARKEKSRQFAEGFQEELKF